MDVYIIEKQLRNKGYKLTEQRSILIDILNKSETPCTAQEVYEAARQKCNINFSTVYRNLELLSKLKIITSLNIKQGVTHFEIMGAGHHHHAICKGCGEVQVIEICPCHSLDSRMLEQLGFTPTELKFEIYGYCSKCNIEQNR